jgi:hypothetical protein
VYKEAKLFMKLEEKKKETVAGNRKSCNNDSKVRIS